MKPDLPGWINVLEHYGLNSTTQRREPKWFHPAIVVVGGTIEVASEHHCIHCRQVFKVEEEAETRMVGDATMHGLADWKGVLQLPPLVVADGHIGQNLG